MSSNSTENSLKPGAPLPGRPGWLIFCPLRKVNTVQDVTVHHLKEMGIRAVILDLDNTLVEWHQEEIAEHIMVWLKELQREKMELCILSNSVLSRRSERIANRLGCHFVRQAKKPGKKGFQKCMELMKTTPRETAIVGDQMFTDILGGNRVGIYTIMVTPLQKHEFAYTRYISRPPERALMRYFKRKGHL
jgi:uncharacterized protein